MHYRHLTQQPCRIGINLILQMGNPRSNEVNELAQGHKQINVILKDSKALAHSTDHAVFLHFI